MKHGLLDIPVLYMSRYIVRTKSDYYRLLQSVRDDDTWEEWVTYLLTAVRVSVLQSGSHQQPVHASVYEDRIRGA